MTFEEAWNSLAIGDEVTVTDRTPEPTNSAGMPWRAWRSHNFTGRLIDKIDGEWRAMKIEMAPEGGATVAYTVQEAVPHTFAEAG